MTKPKHIQALLSGLLFVINTAFGAVSANEVFDKGLKAYNSKDYAMALSIWKPLAEQGNAHAQYSLGIMYANGQGITKNEAEAVKWYRKAADQGDAHAQHNLGFMYVNGLGVPKNETEAVKWYHLAADQGHAKAQCNLGTMYANGYGVPKDEAEAMKWWRKAADQGSAEAQFNLGVMYDKGLGIAKDEAEAVKWYRLAADQGFVLARASISSLESQLQDAASKGQIPEVERLIKAGVNLEHSNAFVSAARSGQINVVKYLVEHGADPNGGLSRRGEPISAAALKGNKEILKYLKGRGADFNAEPLSMPLPLISAVNSGDPDTARLLIEYGADVNRISRDGNTALREAIMNTNGKSVEFVQLLLKHGADPDIKDKNGVTVRWAAKSDRSGTLSALIEKAKPAPPNAKIPPKTTAEDMMGIEMTLVFKEICDTKLPGYRENTAAAYTAWRKNNASVIASVESSSQYQTMKTEFLARSSTTNTQEMNRDEARDLDKICNNDLIDAFDEVVGRKPNPQFASPKKTWDRFLSALRQGDRKTAITCLSSTARDKSRSAIQQATDEQLRTWADSLKHFSLSGLKFSNIIEGLVTYPDGHGALIYFEEVNGEWKISEM